MEAKRYVNAHVIVDDDPRALTNHPTAIPVCIAHPWNEEFRSSEEVGMVVVNHLDELPGHIEFIRDFLDREEEALL
jgi:hypothetical protein